MACGKSIASRSTARESRSETTEFGGSPPPRVRDAKRHKYSRGDFGYILCFRDDCALLSHDLGIIHNAWCSRACICAHLASEKGGMLKALMRRQAPDCPAGSQNSPAGSQTLNSEAPVPSDIGIYNNGARRSHFVPAVFLVLIMPSAPLFFCGNYPPGGWLVAVIHTVREHSFN